MKRTIINKKINNSNDKKIIKNICFAFLALCITLLSLTSVYAVSQLPVSMGTAADFGVLAGSAITNTGDTVIANNLGLSPGLAISGFPPGLVNSEIYSADAVALQAQSDLTIAYNDLAQRSTEVIIISSGELGDSILTPGLYRSGISSFAISSGNLTLDAQGDANAIFIFQMPSSSLTTISDTNVLLINNASPYNVFWQVGSSATLGTNSVFKGSIMALTSITLTTGASLEGRALARNGAVTLDSNNILLSCNALSNSTTTCGDGILTSDEECDAGSNNGLTCTPQHCGEVCSYCNNVCENVFVQGNACPPPPIPPTGVPEFSILTILMAVIISGLGLVYLRKQ
jgi:hypothetical protein